MYVKSIFLVDVMINCNRRSHQHFFIFFYKQHRITQN